MISGVVKTADGRAIGGARVAVPASPEVSPVRSGAGGGFSLEAPGEPPYTVRAESPGFVPAEVRLDSATDHPVIVLSPGSASEEITVTAARVPRAVGRVAETTVILSREDLEATAAPALDDALRQAPGFSLFRRSGSRTANPTAQGVSLRGLGASGTSRALVLDDGIPVNDAFGGWISWASIPEPALDRVEIVAGGGSDLWGNAALGGVIHLVRRKDQNSAAELDAYTGSQETSAASVHLASSAESVFGAVDAEAFRTAGYVAVAPEARGVVDVRSASRHRAVDALAGIRRPGEASVFARVNLFEESRGNGTPLQRNDTTISRWSAGFDGTIGGGSATVRLSRTDELFHQTFTAIAPDRASEAIVSSQRVPSSSTGGSFQWSRSLGAVHEIVSGVEARAVEGTSQDTVYLSGGPSFRPSGGRQGVGGAFLEDIAAISSRWTATAAIRFDAWANFGGHSVVAGQRVAFADRSESAWSPRLSLVFAAAPGLAWTASAYRSFRAPTLNELYRPFRLGSIQTLANSDLRPERLAGVETGFRWQSHDAWFFARVNAFWAELSDAVGSLTVSTTESLITRRRDNIGTVRDRGFEASWDARIGSSWTASGGYLLADSRISSSDRNPSLVGKRVPQVPRDQATLQVRFARPELGAASLQARWSGAQYDDDRNDYRLGSAFTLDAMLSRPVSRGGSVYVASENLTDRRTEIGRTPVLTLAQGRSFRAGLRWRIE